MAIRLTGLVSNMDTDAMVQELVKAYSKKKEDLEKSQTKLSWKQESWKNLNNKVNSLYKTLGEIKFAYEYRMKKTTVSNPSVASIIAGDSAVNGTQTLKVDKLAKEGYLTGGVMKTTDGSKVTGNTTLEQLGAFSTGDSGSFDVTVGGKRTTINMDSSTTISQLVDKLSGAGLTASFDAVNQRMFINSGKSGKDNDFTMEANDAKGLQALSKLQLLTKNGVVSDPAAGESPTEYEKWANLTSSEFNDLVDDEVTRRVNALKDDIKALTDTNDSLKTANQDMATTRDSYATSQTFQDALTNTGIPNSGGSFNAADVKQKVDDMEARQKSIVDKQVDRQKLVDKLAAGSADGSLSQTDKDSLKAQITQLDNDITSISNTIAAEADDYAALKAYTSFNDAIDANNASIAANDAVIATKQKQVDDEPTTNSIRGVVTAEYTAKQNAAKDAINNISSLASDTANRVLGADAEIYLNGAKFTSDSNSFTVNGLTITAQELTNGNEVSINTTFDVDGVYDKIKKFINQYSELINEMDASYNAESSKGYEPLTNEEKESMSEGDIEKWEKKIKDSILRRDSTLADVSNAMKMTMMGSYNINGKDYSLSSFGIETLGYFLAGDNERNAYHIFGDADDSAVAKETNELKKMIASDPEVIEQFFSRLTSDLYDTVNDKMKFIKDISSSFTVYEDKKMQKEYDDYTAKIKEQQKKLEAIEDKYYKQFAAMETAMAKMQSQSNALTNMLGG